MSIDPNSLIGTRQPAPRQWQMLAASRQSEDYANLDPYPTHAFGADQWPTKKGPRPTALPYAETLVMEGATFVFRNGNPKFSVAGDEDADALLQDIIQQNFLPGQYVSLAENAGHQGAIAALFSFDEDDKLCPVRISFLSIPQECRVWVDHRDITRVLMARIQYPYRDESGDWYYHREEWTDDWHVTYRPRYAGKADIAEMSALPDYASNLGDGDGSEWAELEDKRDPNPFQLIPVVVIRNRIKKGNPLGEGDCWRAFRLMDRLALTMHGEDRSNQLHSDPWPVATNARIEGGGDLLPGEPLSLTQDSPQGGPPDMKLLEPHGQARQYTYKSMEKWESLLYGMVGLSQVDPATVSNKGNMTRAVFMMLYARTIATSDRKREAWGTMGLCVLFQRLLVGLKNLGGIKAVANITPATTVSCEWPDYFGETPGDVADTTDRTVKQVDAGLLPPRRAAERLAKAEKMPPDEIEEMLSELDHQHQVRAALAQLDNEDAVSGSDETGAEGADIADASGLDNFAA